MTTEPVTLDQYIDQAGLRHFTGEEICRYFKRPLNEYPPRQLWGNLIAVLRVVDEARDVAGHPVIVTSSYRSPRYNAKVGGAKYSQHLMAAAIDSQCRAIGPRRWHAILRALRDQGRFKGGLGLYRTFVHVDVRGVNADW